MKPLLTLSDLSCTGLPDEWLSLKGISLSLCAGEFISIFCPSKRKNPLFSLIKGDFMPDSGRISYPNEPDTPIHLGHLCLDEELFSWSSTFSNRPPRLSNPELSFLLEHYKEHCQTTSAKKNICYCSQIYQLLLTLSQIPDLLLLEDLQANLQAHCEPCLLDELYRLKQNCTLSCLLLTSCPQTALLLSDFIYLLNPHTGHIFVQLQPCPYYTQLLPSQKLQVSDFMVYLKILENEISKNCQ